MYHEEGGSGRGSWHDRCKCGVEIERDEIVYGIPCAWVWATPHETPCVFARVLVCIRGCSCAPGCVFAVSSPRLSPPYHTLRAKRRLRAKRLKVYHDIVNGLIRLGHRSRAVARRGARHAYSPFLPRPALAPCSPPNQHTSNWRRVSAYRKMISILQRLRARPRPLLCSLAPCAGFKRT